MFAPNDHGFFYLFTVEIKKLSFITFRIWSLDRRL